MFISKCLRIHILDAGLFGTVLGMIILHHIHAHFLVTPKDNNRLHKVHSLLTRA